MSYDATTLTTPCPRHGCGAVSGEFCLVYRVGGVREVPHRARTEAAHGPPDTTPRDPLTVWCARCSSTPGEPCVRGNRYTAQQFGQAVPPLFPAGAFHVVRRRTAGVDVPRPLPLHREPSMKQVAAREQNWTLFQVTGALGNLRQAAQKQRLSNDSRADLQIAIDALARIDERNKRGCP